MNRLPFMLSVTRTLPSAFQWALTPQPFQSAWVTLMFQRPSEYIRTYSRRKRKKINSPQHWAKCSQNLWKSRRKISKCYTCVTFQNKKALKSNCFKAFIGGDGGSRTHVQKYFRRTFSERSQCFVIRRIRRDADTLRNCYPVSPLKYQELFQRFPAFMTPDFKPAGEPEAARGAELCSQCEIVVIFSVYI